MLSLYSKRIQSPSRGDDGLLGMMQPTQQEFFRPFPKLRLTACYAINTHFIIELLHCHDFQMASKMIVVVCLAALSVVDCRMSRVGFPTHVE